MKVVILGSTGMLGSALSQYFNGLDGFDAYMSYHTTKPSWDGNLFQFSVGWNRVCEIPNADYVINCIGCIKQRHYDYETIRRVNTSFPRELASWCQQIKAKLIHVSTDCVFSGAKGNYTESDVPDATDDYGRSKFQGEPPNCMVLRTSVVGPELGTNYSLLAWAQSQAGKTVNGYINHFWNGVSSPTYANVCQQIMTNDLWVPELRHVFSTTVSKYDMLVAINAKYDLGLTIQQFSTPTPIDRTLATNYTFNQSLNLPDFQTMLDQL